MDGHEHDDRQGQSGSASFFDRVTSLFRDDHTETDIDKAMGSRTGRILVWVSLAGIGIAVLLAAFEVI